MAGPWEKYASGPWSKYAPKQEEKPLPGGLTGAGLSFLEGLGQATERAYERLPSMPNPVGDYFGRVAGNIPQDVLNVAQSMTPEALGGLGSALYNRPLETASQIGSAALQGAGGLFDSQAARGYGGRAPRSAR